MIQNTVFQDLLALLQATEKKNSFHMPRLVTSICSDQWATLHGWHDLHGDDSLPSAEVTESPQCVLFSIHLCIPLRHAVKFFDGITFAELSDADFFPFPFPKESFGHFAGRSKEELKSSSLVLSYLERRLSHPCNQKIAFLHMEQQHTTKYTMSCC